jgi:recombination protein RecT
MLATTPRPAASLILVRDAPDGPEVLMGRRRIGARAFPDALVFPGGKLEPDDAEAEARAGYASAIGPAPAGARHAALRETFEETGLWLASEGQSARFPHAPGFGRLIPYAHWVTPERNVHRFDTWFFLAVATLAEAQTPLFGDEFETLAWGRPARVLEEHASVLLAPTRHSLKRLARQTSMSAMLADARATGVFEAEELVKAWSDGRQL